MPSFNPGPFPVATAPFGRNVFLASTHFAPPKSATVAQSGVPTVVIDGEQRKILQSGEVLARITAAGDDQGKLGVYQVDATDGRGDLANIVGISKTFAPWELIRHDIDAGVLYSCTAKQSKCIYRAADGSPVVGLTDTIAAALVGKKSLSIIFQP